MKKQYGASTLGVLIVVLFFGALVTLTVKLGPIYLDDLTIQESVEGLEKTQGLAKMPERKVRELIRKRLSVNNVRNLEDESITIETEDDRVLINVNYERRTGIFRNIDALVSFNHTYEMKGQ